jgi:hypothetical protein
VSDARSELVAGRWPAAPVRQFEETVRRGAHRRVLVAEGRYTARGSQIRCQPLLQGRKTGAAALSLQHPLRELDALLEFDESLLQSVLERFDVMTGDVGAWTARNPIRDGLSDRAPRDDKDTEKEPEHATPCFKVRRRAKSPGQSDVLRMASSYADARRPRK